MDDDIYELPADMKAYVTEFFHRKNYIVFGFSGKFFELTEYDGFYGLTTDKKEIPGAFTSLDKIFEAIKENVKPEVNAQEVAEENKLIEELIVLDGKIKTAIKLNKISHHGIVRIYELYTNYRDWIYRKFWLAIDHDKEEK